MHKITLFILAAVFAVALAEGQYYVPRAYYTIDAEGHESAHVPLRRLRRSLQPYPYVSGAKGQRATANANAEALDGGSATSNANAQVSGSQDRRWDGRPSGWSGHPVSGWGYDEGGNGDWALPSGQYGASNPASRH